MRKNIPASIYTNAHQDYPVISIIENDILKKSGGLAKLSDFYSDMLRDEIDKLVDTPNTDRREYKDLEKVEKTYIGTRVEIRIRKFWGYPKGFLDLKIQHIDVDIKHTMESGWMFPTEVFDQACVLSAADEATGKCYLGLIMARKAYLGSGPGNRDQKLQLTADGWKNIRWLLYGMHYPPNFWKTLDLNTVNYIFSGASGTERLYRLFSNILDRRISRKVVVDTARQLDSLKRLRKNGGARDRLLNDGVLLLSGNYDKKLILALQLEHCSAGDFISHRISGAAEKRIAASHGITVP